NGTPFKNQLMQDIAKIFAVAQHFTAAYHPQSDGHTERFNGTLIGMIRKYVEAGQRDWDDHIAILLFAYNTRRHDSTGFSPYMMNYGREAITPADAVFKVQQ